MESGSNADPYPDPQPCIKNLTKIIIREGRAVALVDLPGRPRPRREPLPLAGHRDMAGQLAGGQDEEGLPAYQDVGVVGVVVHLLHLHGGGG